MMNRKKGGFFWTLVGIVFLCIAFLCGGPALAAEAKNPIKIGYVSAFTGVMGESSTRNLLAFRMAIEEANKTGGLAGRQVEILVRDDKGSAADHARLAKDLVYTDKVDLLTGAPSSIGAMAAAQVAKEMKTPTLILSTGAEGPSIQRNRYLFRIIPHYKVQTGTMATFAIKKGWKKIALMNPDYAYGRVFSDDTKHWLAKAPGFEVKDDLYPKFGAVDYAPYITKLLAIKDLDAILSGLWAGDVTAFLKQAKPYGLLDKVSLVIFIESPHLEAMGKDMPQGIYGFDHFFAWIPTKEAQKFAKSYYDYTGKYPAMDINGYCTALAYIAAVRKAGTADREAVINAMEGINFDSPTGRVTVRPFDHQATMRGVIGRTVFKPEYPEFAVLEDFYMPDAEQFLPTKEEIEKLKPF